MKMKKKATWLGYGTSFAPFLTLILFFIASVSHADFKARDVPVGYDQLAILKSDIRAQKALLFLDYAGQIAVEQSIYDVAGRGGHYSSPCNDYYGYSLWQDLVEEQGSIALKDCTDVDINRAFTFAMNNNLQGDLMTEYPELMTTGYTSSISKDGEIKSIGNNAVHFSITTKLIGLPDFGPETAAKDIHVEGETPVERMFAACSKEKLDATNGLENLKSVTKLWVEESMDDGAAYVRGGQTSNKMPYTCSGGGQDYWMYNHLTTHFPNEQLPCVATKKNRGGAECTKMLTQIYQNKIVDRFSGRYLCGDCGTYLVQLYNCAFGRLSLHTTHPKTAPVVAATPGVIQGYDAKGNIMLNKDVWGSKTSVDDDCWDTIQSQLGGRLQFGDIIQLPGHWIMYTGGAGLDYEILEMGGWRFPEENIKERAKILIEIGPEAYGGIRTSKTAKGALSVNLLKKKGCIVHRAAEQPAQFGQSK